MDNDGVVGRGSPDVGDWGGKGDFGMVKDGLGVVLRDGRDDPAGIAVFTCRSARDCLGVDVEEVLLDLASLGGTPEIELLDTEDVFEKVRGRCNPADCNRRPRVEGYLPLALGGRGGRTLS